MNDGLKIGIFFMLSVINVTLKLIVLINLMNFTVIICDLEKIMPQNWFQEMNLEMS